MTGIVMAGSGFGMIAFPPLINWFISSYNWRLSFIFLSAIVLIISILAVLLLKSNPGQAAKETASKNNDTLEGVKVGNKSFSLREAMQTRQFWLFCIMLLCYGFCFFAILVHIASYATDLGISSSGAATIMAISGGAGIVGQIGFGSISDRIGNRNAFLIGLVLIVMAILTLILARELWVFFVFAILLGIASGDCATQESPITAWLFGMASHGLIFGVFSFSFTIGAAIGPLVFGYIFDTTGSYQYAFLVSAALAILAVMLGLFLKQTGPTSVSETTGTV
jgi:MFS family permease